MPLGKPGQRYTVEDPAINRAIQDLYDHFAAIQQTVPAKTTAAPAAPIQTIVKTSPNIVSFTPGSPSNPSSPQLYAMIPALTAVPSNNPGPGSPYALDGVVIEFAPNPGDHGVLFRYTGTPAYQWFYEDGILYRTQSEIAALTSLLGVVHVNLLVWVSDYGHMLQWKGAGWRRGPGDPEHSDMFYPAASLPTDIGWKPCDGSTGVSYLKYDGSLGTRDLPNTDATMAYPKAGPTYSPVIASPVDPVFSGGSVTAAGTVASTFTPSGGGSAMAGVDVSTISGGSVTSTFTGTPTPVTGGTVLLPGDSVPNFPVILVYRQ